jgi:hypothetical protein
MSEINTDINNQITDIANGPWHQTGGVVGPIGLKIDYVPDSLVGEASVNLRVQYYNGRSFVESVYSNVLNSTVIVPVNQFGSNGISVVKFRVESYGVPVGVLINSNAPLLNGHYPLPGSVELSGLSVSADGFDAATAKKTLFHWLHNNAPGFCFIAGTMIDMWPLDPDIRPDANGLYDEAKMLALVWQKPIEQITPDDWVVSFDKAGHLKPGKVTRTFNNEAKIILDFFGTGVTPGHVYYRPDSKRRHKFEPLIDILRDDGVIQKSDGTLIRAATNCEVGSEDDRELWAFTVDEDKDGNERIRDKKKLRLGTRWMLPNGNHFSMREYMQGIGLELLPNGYVRWKQTGLTSPFVWTLSDTLPNPEDFVLARSGTTLEDIYKAAEWEALRPDMPPPMVRDSGPVQPLSQAGLTLMPRNTPLAMREGGTTGMFNRKQRKAAEAEKRQQAKGKKRLVH